MIFYCEELDEFACFDGMRFTNDGALIGMSSEDLQFVEAFLAPFTWVFVGFL